MVCQGKPLSSHVDSILPIFRRYLQQDWPWLGLAPSGRYVAPVSFRGDGGWGRATPILAHGTVASLPSLDGQRPLVAIPSMLEG
jgi:hypothetical protein